MKQKAFILAVENSNVEVFGVSIIRRLILLLKKLDVEDVSCIYFPRHKEVLETIRDIVVGEQCISVVDLMENSSHFSELVGKDIDEVIFLRGDIVLDRISLGRLIGSRNDKVVLLRNKDEKPLSVAVKLPAIQTERLSELLRTILSNHLSDPVFLQSAEVVYGNSGFPFIVSNNPMSISEAEARLMETLGQQTAETDGFMARNFDRYVSRFFSKRLVRTGLHPNWFTIMGMSIGLVGAHLLARPTYGSRLAGALLFVFCIMVDGVDGEIARLTLKDSTFGHYLDIITDNIVHVAIFVALPLGFYRQTGNPLYLKVLWLLLAGLAFAGFSAYYCIFRVERRYKSNVVHVLEKLASRDFAYLIVLLAMANRLDWFLWGSLVGSYIFGIILWVYYVKCSSLASAQDKV